MMKAIKTIIASVLITVLIFALCGCGQNTADSQAIPEEYVGTYTLFGIKTAQSGDAVVSVEGSTDVSTVTLNADGTGSFDNSAYSNALTFVVNGSTVTITDLNNETMTAVMKGGVLELKLADGEYGYFAKPGADTSSYDVKSADVLSAQNATE